MVAELLVLLGVEHLQHRARRVAAEVRAHLVDLVDHHHRVVRAGVAERPDDRARHRADVGAPVAADLGLVAHAAHRDALELASHRAGDRLAERRLADPRRADEAQDRRARVRLQLAHGQELEDALLDLVDVVVVAVERLTGFLEVEVVLGGHAPRQLHDPLEVGPDHAVLGGLRRQSLESLQLAIGLLAHHLRQVGLFDPLAQLGSLGGALVGLAELLLDRLELLAQEVLALGAVHLGLDLRLDPRPQRDQLVLAREQLEQAPQPLREVALLEQLLALLGLDPERAGDHVRELGRVVEVRDRHLQLLRQVRHLLDDLAEGVLHVAGERLELGGLLDHVGVLLDARDEVRLGGDEVGQPHALPALHEDPQRAVRDLDHARDGSRHPHAVEVVRAGALDVGVLRGDHHQHPLAGQHVVDQLDRALLPDRERRERVRERDGVLQRQHRQALGERAPDLHVLRLTGGGDLDAHYSSALGSIGMRRASSVCCTSGISIRRMPSS